MKNFWFLALALTVTGLLLLARRFLFRGTPVSHRRVFIISFGKDNGNPGRLEDDWPSVIGVEAEASPLIVGSEIKERLEAGSQL
jgi:hypothetical protein